MNHPKLKFTFFLLISLLSINLSAQYQLNGVASVLDNNCIELTPEEGGEIGSVWFLPKINLEESFNLTTNLFFGCNDDGADGITFVLHTDSTGLGSSGGFMGYGFLTPSVAIEFDTYKNTDYFDPTYDHVSIMAMGSIDHGDVNLNLAGPVLANPDDENIEDCEYHEIRINWNAIGKKLQIFFDCGLRLTYTGDVVNNFFSGDPYVYFGFTAATGGKKNQQIICLEDLKTIKPLPDYVMCPDGSIQLEASGGDTYQWAPAETLNNPNIANPLASPTQTTTYMLTITDGCIDFYDTLTIEVAGDFVDFNFTDTTLCENESILLDATTNNATYEWSNGAITPTIIPTTSAYYIVTVTLEDLCVSNAAAQIDFIELPSILFSGFETICAGQTITLDASFSDATYLWQDGSTEPIFNVTEAGEYSVVLDHYCGTKTISTDIIFDRSCKDVFIPNVFSPNFDGTNDYFMILDDGDVELVKRFSITDRWGNAIFEARNFLPNDQTYGWDGTFKGKELGNGVYVYLAELVFRDGTIRIFKGDVSVVR